MTMKLLTSGFVFIFTVFGSQVHAACPNPLSTIFIPTIGTVTVQACDQSGNVLNGPYTIQKGQNSLGSVVNSTTSPAVSVSNGNMVFSANTAVSGSSDNFYICFTPASKCSVVPFVVGSPVSSISFGTP